MNIYLEVNYIFVMCINKFLLIIAIILSPNYAHAYLGLGPVLPLLGTVLSYALIGIIACVGFVSYPMMVLYKKFKNRKIKKDQLVNK